MDIDRLKMRKEFNNWVKDINKERNLHRNKYQVFASHHGFDNQSIFTWDIEEAKDKARFLFETVGYPYVLIMDTSTGKKVKVLKDREYEKRD